MNDDKRYSLEEIKNYINLQDLISLQSEIYLTENTFENLVNKKIKLTIKRLTSQNGIFKLKLFFRAESGEFFLRFWDETSEIVIEDGVKGVWDIHCANHSKINIGKNSTSNGTKIIAINSDVHIDEDCMFSDGILLQASDQHGIVDIKQKKIINNYRRFINIMEHVWVARNATVMPDVIIEKGSIVATGAIVTKNVPKCSIVGGVPAKVVKSGMTWSRFTNNFNHYSQLILNDEEYIDD